MPMNDAGMSAAIKAKIVAAFGPAHDDTKLQEFCDAAGGGIVEYVQANAAVPSGITVAVSTGTGLGATTGAGTVQ